MEQTCKWRKPDHETEGKNTGIGSVVASHYNQLEEKGLRERSHSRIFYMRNFNNWLKSYLISHHLELVRNSKPGRQGIVALDMGCGKGGDLLKWQKGNIDHLICVDIAGTSMTQCKERHEISRKKRSGDIFDAEFIVADCTKAQIKQLLRNSDMKVDIVSCQFALHYCFESLSQAETMIKNVSENLAIGGYFIASIPDANAIMLQLKKSEKMSFGNEVFRIEFPEDRPSNPPLFGDKYQFFLEGVVDCPEFLVHFPTLVRLCNKYGLELVYKRRFPDLCKDAENHRESRSLLFKMIALELYPAQDKDTNVSSSNEEYSHARSYMEMNNLKEVLTLSRSEWEAISLYLAVAFKKVS